MEQWTVQLLTIIGVAVGATGSFFSTRLLDRGRWQREETIRWDTKRLDCYTEFGTAMKHFVNLSRQVCAGLGLPAPGQPADPSAGLSALTAAEQDVSVKWEQILMLGNPKAISAGREWREVAWHLECFARGARDDATEYTRVDADSGLTRNQFYAAARADLGIVSGDIPDFGPWPSWEESVQHPPGAPGA